MAATSLMNFRVTPEEREAINSAAAVRGVSASELIRTALKEPTAAEVWDAAADELATNGRTFSIGVYSTSSAPIEVSPEGFPTTGGALGPWLKARNPYRPVAGGLLEKGNKK